MEIHLTKGFTAIVDDDDFEWLAKYKWNANPNGGGNVYAVTWVYRNGKRRCIRMHRAIIEKHQGIDLKGKEIDHINRNSLDNRKENIRVCTRRENLLNRKTYKTNSTGVRGVYWDKNLKKWLAAITINGKKIHLGVFKDKAKAKEAYEAVRAR